MQDIYHRSIIHFTCSEEVSTHTIMHMKVSSHHARLCSSYCVQNQLFAKNAKKEKKKKRSLKALFTLAACVLAVGGDILPFAARLLLLFMYPTLPLALWIGLHNPAPIGRQGLTKIPQCTSTGHVHNAVVLYQRTIHIQLYSADQSKPVEEPYLWMPLGTQIHMLSSPPIFLPSLVASPSIRDAQPAPIGRKWLTTIP